MENTELLHEIQTSTSETLGLSKKKELVYS
jgi:malate dehydrogenase (quinone)